MFKKGRKEPPPVPQSQQAFAALHLVRLNGASDSPPLYDTSESNARPSLMQRQSASNLFHRHGSTSKNNPYVPPSDVQQHIDILDKGASLDSVVSNTQTDYFDVLPSFQMFQSILKRDSDQFSENFSAIPPIYGDTKNSSRTPPVLSGRNSASMTPVLSPALSPTLSPMTSAIASAAAAADANADTDVDNGFALDEAPVTINYTLGHSPLDNIDRLEKSSKSPIDLQIYVTKKVPHPDVNNDLETRLKEYTSEDLVNGYVVITNTCDQPVDFGLFTVSLEGTIKISELGLSESKKLRKVLMKKFLKMYDLSASYAYTLVPNSAGIEYVPFAKDLFDGCLIGLPNDRILQPNTKYKKFFTFKFPLKLLDNSCVNNLMPHLFPPPSTGLDKTCFYNRGDNIALNKALGYGFLNVRGTPLLTKDYSFDNVSVSYTIEAKFIDKLNSHQQDPVSPHDINDPNSEAEYVIAKSSQYYLRFIPNVSQKLRYYESSFDSTIRNGIAWKLFHNYRDNHTWRAIDDLQVRIDREIDEKLTKEELSVADLKLKNLIILPQADRLPTKDNPTHEDELVLHSKTANIFGKKKKSILSSLVKIGELKMSIAVPDSCVPYSSPRLLMKYNTDDDLSLNPVHLSSSHINEVYHRDEQVDSLDVSLTFTSDESSKPPQISSIETNLVLWTYNSDYPIPFELSYDFFYHNPRDTKTTDDAAVITRSNLQHLKDEVFNYMHFFKSTDIQISRNSFLYLKSMKHLAVKRDIIKEYYKGGNPESLPEWKGAQMPDKKVKWVKTFKLPLTVVNKNNVNLLPTFHNCLVGRIYCLQVVIKYKGASGEVNEFGDNVVRLDIPVAVG